MIDDKFRQTGFHFDIGHFEFVREDIGAEYVIVVLVLEEEGFAAVGTLLKERTTDTFKSLIILEMKEGDLGNAALATVGESGNDFSVLIDVVS